jgi:hypothetical protein
VLLTVPSQSPLPIAAEDPLQPTYGPKQPLRHLEWPCRVPHSQGQAFPLLSNTVSTGQRVIRSPSTLQPARLQARPIRLRL